MISFKLTEEQEVIREAMREFATQELAPIARECDEASKISNDFLESTWQLGLTFTQIPEEYGGGGERSPISNAIILEELASGDAALAVAAFAPSAFVNAIVDQGSEAQKAQYLPAFCGEHVHHRGARELSSPWPWRIPPTPVRWPKKRKTVS